MTTFGVSGMVFQCVFEGSLSMQDTKVERRPYHKNCNCALHKSKGSACSNTCAQRNISFPKKQPWTDSSVCISAATSKFSSQHCLPSTTSMSTANREMGMKFILCHIDNRRDLSEASYSYW